MTVNTLLDLSVRISHMHFVTTATARHFVCLLLFASNSNIFASNLCLKLNFDRPFSKFSGKPTLIMQKKAEKDSVIPGVRRMRTNHMIITKITKIEKPIRNA